RRSARASETVWVERASIVGTCSYSNVRWASGWAAGLPAPPGLRGWGRVQAEGGDDLLRLVRPPPPGPPAVARLRHQLDLLQPPLERRGARELTADLGRAVVRRGEDPDELSEPVVVQPQERASDLPDVLRRGVLPPRAVLEQASERAHGLAPPEEPPRRADQLLDHRARVGRHRPAGEGVHDVGVPREPVEAVEAVAGGVGREPLEELDVPAVARPAHRRAVPGCGLLLVLVVFVVVPERRDAPVGVAAGPEAQQRALLVPLPRVVGEGHVEVALDARVGPVVPL